MCETGSVHSPVSMAFLKSPTPMPVTKLMSAGIWCLTLHCMQLFGSSLASDTIQVTTKIHILIVMLTISQIESAPQPEMQDAYF